MRILALVCVGVLCWFVLEDWIKVRAGSRSGFGFSWAGVGFFLLSGWVVWCWILVVWLGWSAAGFFFLSGWDIWCWVLFVVWWILLVVWVDGLLLDSSCCLAGFVWCWILLVVWLGGLVLDSFCFLVGLVSWCGAGLRILFVV